MPYIQIYNPHLIIKVIFSKLQVRSTRTKKHAALARRMMIIIVTDFVCWFPVIVISILTLTGKLYDPTKKVYAWIAVFVLPVNSAINPLLYTFSTPYVREKIPVVIEALSRLIRRIRVQGILFVNCLNVTYVRLLHYI